MRTFLVLLFFGHHAGSLRAARAFLICALANALPGPAVPQVSQEAPLLIGFGEFPPYYFREATGARAGFSVELAEAISEEIGVTLNFAEFQTAAGVINALASGEISWAPGVPVLPFLGDNVVYSDRIAVDAMRLMTLSERVAELSNTRIEGRRIGVVPLAEGADEQALLSANTTVEYPTQDGAMLALLAGDVDAVLSINPLLFYRAREVGVDARIGFVDPPIRNIERVVALHASRADLLPRINAAISRMEADGRLAALRSKYFIDLPAPPPEVLRVAVMDTPLIAEFSKDGKVEGGYAVELVSALAARADLEIEFVRMSDEDYFSAAAGTVDVIPFVQASKEVLALRDLTLPIDSAALDILVRKEDGRFQSVPDLATARVGMFPNAAAAARTYGFPAAQIVTVDNIDDAVAALGHGGIDALMGAAYGLESEGITEQFRSLGPPDFALESSIGLRPGLGAVREQLNAIIPGFVLSEEYSALRQRYFTAPVFWTQTRLYTALGIALTALSLSGAFQLWDQQRQRRRAFALQEQELLREKAHATQLKALVQQLEQTNREQAEFTYAISHDLKSPANTIGMLIEALTEDGHLDGEAQELLDDMARTNLRMRQLVDDVLDYSRLVGEKMASEPVELNELLDGICCDLKHCIEAANAEFNIGELPTVLGNRMQLRMLFQNLISNAVKFRAPDRRPMVCVRGEMRADGQCVTVTDNGIGIPAEYRDKVFGLFQRLHGRTSYEGTGLGLSICQRVMVNHKGSIRITDGIDGGSQFEMTFPEVI